MRTFAVAAQQILRPIAGAVTEKRTGLNITNGFTAAVRDREVRTLAINYQSDKSKIIEKSSQCYAWTMLIVKDIQEGKLTDPSQVALPAAPLPVAAIAADMEKWVTASFQAWKEEGASTPSEFKDALKRSLEK
ncbi:hypothetical protein [Microvirga lotononidis]|uniref:Uncharacterized protein n=1 Tax=Microvirga lotononidis TaxID=864069 RepID=I4YTA7_9HYPH|nr:hypothetical protein [Microvirga lotononidis]EIM27199.1 hypothetical protein MicloDRAFT_00037550 [Microvirga lotononidis]WQO28622.1 hypothetical protein U0023_05970 [Microvirga lotononidis]